MVVQICNLFVKAICGLSVVLVFAVTAAAADMNFLHNGSWVVWRSEGGIDQAIYQSPRRSLAGLVDIGTVLFEGTKVGNRIDGIAYTFKRGCEPLGFRVKGNFDADKETGFILRGEQPIRDENCDLTGYKSVKLPFIPKPPERDNKTVAKAPSYENSDNLIMDDGKYLTCDEKRARGYTVGENEVNYCNLPYAEDPGRNLLKVIIHNQDYFQASLRLDSQDRSSWWPGPRQAWAVGPGQTFETTLSCNPGEKICYGGWRSENPDSFWARGPNMAACENCCALCGSGTAEWTMLAGPQDLGRPKSRFNLGQALNLTLNAVKLGVQINSIVNQPTTQDTTSLTTTNLSVAPTVVPRVPGSNNSGISGLSNQ